VTDVGEELAREVADGMPLGHALSDLEDDVFRTGKHVSYADADRAAERHGLSSAVHAELVERAVAAGYLVDTVHDEVEVPTREPLARGASGNLDSFQLLLRDVVRYPLLDAKEEVELARAIEAGQRAEAQRDSTGGGKPLDELVERGRTALRRLVACNIRLVISIAHRYQGQGLDLSDLVQAGTIGLIRAAERFDGHLGFKFSTYASWWIRQSVSRQVADTGRLVRLPVHVVERVKRLRRETRKLEHLLGREARVSDLAEALGKDAAEIAFLRDVAQDVLSLDAPLESNASFGDLVASPSADTEKAALAAKVADDVRVVLQELEPREREILVLRYGLDGELPRTLEEVGQLYSLTRERIRQIEVKAKHRLERKLIKRGYGPE
jgi:RNA polymerase primary sigma factor